MPDHAHDLDTAADSDRRHRRHDPPGDDLVIVHGEGISVDRLDDEVPIAEAHHRFGGLDPLAVAAGALAGLGAAVVLLALGAAAASPALERWDDRALTVGGLALALALTALAFLVAGWVAGRVARYEGGRNGLLAGLLLLLLIGALGGGAAAFDEVRGLDLPDWVDTDLGPAALVAAAAAAVLALLLAGAAGRIGASWHRRVDRTLVQTRTGSLGGREVRR